ncbi:ATP-grasp domain-containing protein [Gimesia algae]|uniref:ATP-grasp domain protein n=1 Tax=Gimesia algae TaxID=2527971 RepID=A0A517VCM8_9PLAN|nr:ATP-grasp domain-containing protein [Gimesia algae]QDT90761.1 ATP-grasp domain protein [Gimesia algae]
MNFPGPSSLLIVGGSTRAAACSAVRAGFQPVCADQFADRDLRAISEVVFKIDDHDHWLEEIMKQEPQDWIYTGALENRPELINSINQRHTLLGNAGKSLKKVRDPFFLQGLLANQSIPFATSLPHQSNTPLQGRWLRKPLLSAGGQGIGFVDSHTAAPADATQYYLQQYQPGIPLSALFIAFPDCCVLVGTAVQFIGNRVLHANGFQFCGGMILSPVPPEWRQTLEKLGQSVASGCSLRGLFGCDLIWNPDQQPGLCLTEVNPRYTALTELFELQFRLPLLRWQHAACHSCDASSTVAKSSAEELIQLLKVCEKQQLSPVSKGILYAPTDLTAPDLAFKPSIEQALWQIPALADVPDRRARIPAGTPVCTLYGTGTDQEECLTSLADQILSYQRQIQPEGARDLSRQEASNMLWPGKESEKLFFSGFFSSENVSGSFLED